MWKNTEVRHDKKIDNTNSKRNKKEEKIKELAVH